MASGHGPVFGGAPPTLGKGGWQLDQAWMGRIGRGQQDDDQMLRTMLSLGITEDLQISASLPITLDASIYMPRGRLMSMMSSNQDFESIVGWRFQRECCWRRRTARVHGLRRRHGPNAGITATTACWRRLRCMRERGERLRVTIALLLGERRLSVLCRKAGRPDGRQHFLQRRLRLSPAVPAHRLPRPDLRFFVEAVGEHTARGLHHGFELIPSGGDSIVIGPFGAAPLQAVRVRSRHPVSRLPADQLPARREVPIRGQFHVLFLAEVGCDSDDTKARPLISLAALAIISPSRAEAQDKKIELKIMGMDCAISALGVRVAVQKVDGVESVQLSLERAEADIRLKPENHVSLDQFRRIVKGNGFEPREAKVTVSGSYATLAGN